MPSTNELERTNQFLIYLQEGITGCRLPSWHLANFKKILPHLDLSCPPRCVYLPFHSLSMVPDSWSRIIRSFRPCHLPILDRTSPARITKNSRLLYRESFQFCLPTIQVSYPGRESHYTFSQLNPNF